METICTTLVGTNNKDVSIIHPDTIIVPYICVKDYPDYCGAGEGFANTIVPEKIWGIKVSPACWSHDKMWALAEASWAEFHYCNNVFHVNINTMLRCQSNSWFLYHLRMYRAVTYFNAVDTLGAEVFWRMKRK